MNQDRYLILEKIGKGLHAEVYRALDNERKIEVAIKITGKNIGEKEVEKLESVRHLDIIPKLYDSFLQDGKMHIVQELVRGKTIYDSWVSTQSWDFLWLTIYQILLTIRELHGEGFSHGDAHSNNFMWSGEKMVVIDISSLTDKNREITKLETERMKIEETLPPDWEDEYDYDPFYGVDNAIRYINDVFCEDYRFIFNMRHRRLLLEKLEKASNVNNGKERYLKFIEFLYGREYNDNCRHYVLDGDYDKFYNELMEEYNKIDKGEITPLSDEDDEE